MTATKSAPKADSAAWDNPMGTDGFEFIEYAAPDPAAMGALFESMELDQMRRGVLKSA